MNVIWKFFYMSKYMGLFLLYNFNIFKFFHQFIIILLFTFKIFKFLNFENFSKFLRVKIFKKLFLKNPKKIIILIKLKVKSFSLLYSIRIYMVKLLKNNYNKIKFISLILLVLHVDISGIDINDEIFYNNPFIYFIGVIQLIIFGIVSKDE